MKKALAALLLCCSSLAHAQTTEAPVVEHTIQDDGSSYVPLKFSFPYYGQIFTESWMYDNGVVSFIAPGSPNAVQPWQWYSPDPLSVNANYYIAALWADMAPKQGVSKYLTQGDSTYMKYTWNSVAEYYSVWGNPRFNTFSTTIKPDGSIETHYTSINLQTSNVRVETVGNIALGEITTYYTAPSGTIVTDGTIQDWSVIGQPIEPTPEPTPEPVIEPVYVPVNNTTVEDPAPQPIETIIAEPVAVATPTVAVQQAPAEPVEVVTVASSAPSAPSSVSSSSEKTVSVDAMSIAKNIFRRDAELTNSIVSSSIESSATTASGSDNLMDSSAVGDIATSSTSSNSQKNTASDTNVAQQSSTQFSSDQSTTSQTIMNAQSLAAFASNNTTYSEATEQAEIAASSIQEVAITEVSDNKSNNVTETSVVADETNPTSVRSLAAMNTTKSADFEEQEEQERQRVTEIVANSVTPNELAQSGVELTMLQVVPAGYNTYLSLTIKDAAFYAPKEIYRNQTVVDNAPTQRLMTLASDAKFEEMVSQQYGEK